MAVTIRLGTVSKKRNSTYVPTAEQLPLELSVALKDGCSDYNPVFLLRLEANVFPYNYVQWDTWYYWIDDVVRMANQLFEVHCTQDVLATYKANILATTAFVAYSSVSGGTWLPDKRIPVKSDCVVSRATANLGIWRQDGTYILTVIGKTGACSYSVSLADLQRLISSVQDDMDDVYDTVIDIISNPPSGLTPEALATLQTSLMGNDFANAPSCIRSCIWIPFEPEGTYFQEYISLGNFETKVSGIVVNGHPRTGSVSVSIPWHYSDWRRAYCEDIYLYLPFVGMVGLSSDSLTSASSITIYYSYTVTDGQISYQVVSNGEIIGAYGGSCCAQYPIGINQRASSNEVFNTLLAGAGKTVSDLSHSAIPSVGTGIADAVITAIQTEQVMLSHHPSCVGGVGGGNGAGLPRDIVCYTVAHSTACEPAEMAAVMGVPTQKPISLASCTGYCQCVNAHVAAPASSDAINALDLFINSGFYIE